MTKKEQKYEKILYILEAITSVLLLIIGGIFFPLTIFPIVIGSFLLLKFFIDTLNKLRKKD